MNQKHPIPQAARPKPNVVPTIVSPDMTIHGNMKSAGEVQVEGTVIGDIEVARLVIAEGGTVVGDVVAEELRICGALKGGARGHKITLAASATLTGDVVHELLTIETGARLEGHVRRLQSEPAAAEAVEVQPVLANGYEGAAAH
jgi:cytoskeletal protein CcmA (bactofilin family)